MVPLGDSFRLLSASRFLDFLDMFGINTEDSSVKLIFVTRKIEFVYGGSRPDYILNHVWPKVTDGCKTPLYMLARIVYNTFP